MVTTRILPLVARTMPITNAGVVTVQFTFSPCNYMQLTDIQYQKISSQVLLILLQIGILEPKKGIRVWGEESNYWGVQETLPILLLLFLSSPWMWWAGPTKAGIYPADACLPTGPENPLFSFVPLFRRHVLKKKWNKQKKYLEGTGSINFPLLST